MRNLYDLYNFYGIYSLYVCAKKRLVTLVTTSVGFEKQYNFKQLACTITISEKTSANI